MQRVQKLLSNYGYCSRRKAEKLIEEGRVKVNDKTITIGDKAKEKDKIYVDNKLINKEKKLYLIFNKPINCVTALTDDKYQTVMHYIKIKERVFPIGRLDYKTSGLLLLTNDGDFANKIMHPSYEIKKTYKVEVDKFVSINSIKKIEQGMHLEDGKTAPAEVNQLKDRVLEITIHEGKNRIIRRMMKSLGYQIKTLKRTKISNLELGSLKLGTFRELTEKEKNKIF